MTQEELIKEKKVRVLVTSKISGLFGVDIYVPTKNPSYQPFERIPGTMSLKAKTYDEALVLGIEFYEHYEKENL